MINREAEIVRAALNIEAAEGLRRVFGKISP